MSLPHVVQRKWKMPKMPYLFYVELVAALFIFALIFASFHFHYLSGSTDSANTLIK